MLTRHPLLTGLVVALLTLVALRLALDLFTDALSPLHATAIAGLVAGVVGLATEARLRRIADTRASRR